MKERRIKTRVMTLLAYSLVLIGLWRVSSGAWIYVKAQLAQVLLQRAWAGTLAGQQDVKPWPWADTWPIARLIVPRMSHRSDRLGRRLWQNLGVWTSARGVSVRCS